MAAYFRRAVVGWCFVALLKCHIQHSLAIKREAKSISGTFKTLSDNRRVKYKWKRLHSKHKYRTAQTNVLKYVSYKIEYQPLPVLYFPMCSKEYADLVTRDSKQSFCHLGCLLAALKGLGEIGEGVEGAD